jgi:Dolichyl-phosphate-mannose-protein mannosyltransferase
MSSPPQSLFPHTTAPFRNRLNRLILRVCGYRTVFIVVMCLGIFARVWEFDKLPPGLNADEASIGYEAFSLLHFGVDRNGVSFPVHLISWGSGQNALYAYILMPFIAFGLNTLTVRLPMLLTGLLALPLFFYVASQLFDKKFGLVAMFLLAISPWHILLSRWALESNLLPFVFLIGFACLLRAQKNNRWFILACIALALCLYAYGTAYAAVPLFLIGAVVIAIRSMHIRPRVLVTGLCVFSLLAIPIGLFIVVNVFKLDTLHLGFLSIPRLPTQPRYEGVSALFSGNPIQAIGTNAQIMLNLLWSQTDDLIFNSIRPYGYFYLVTFLIAVLGAGLLIPWQRASQRLPERLLLLTWLTSALILGLLQPVNINRLNLIFFPLILCVVACLAWISSHLPIALPIMLIGFLIGFVAFTIDYHGEAYRQLADQEFSTGLLPAIDFARQLDDQAPICIFGNINAPYIYVLFDAQMNPADYLSTVVYVNSDEPIRRVRSFGRYTFKINSCPADRRTIYILSEPPPQAIAAYQVRVFDRYTVYMPPGD